MAAEAGDNNEVRKFGVWLAHPHEAAVDCQAAQFEHQDREVDRTEVSSPWLLPARQGKHAAAKEEVPEPGSEEDDLLPGGAGGPVPPEFGAALHIHPGVV